MTHYNSLNTKAGCSLYRAHCAVQEVSQNKIPITYVIHFRDISSTTAAEMETAAAEMETHNIVHTPTLSFIMKFEKKRINIRDNAFMMTLDIAKN